MGEQKQLTIQELNDNIQSVIYDEKKEYNLGSIRGYFSNARLLLSGVSEELQDDSKIYLDSNRVSRKDINKLHAVCEENGITEYEIIFDSVWHEWDSEYSEFERTDIEMDVIIFKK